MRWVCRAWATGKTRALKTQTGSLAWLCKCWHRIQQLSGFKKDICELHTLRIHSNICYQRGIPVCESNFTHNLKEGQDLMWIEHGPWRYLLINPNYIPLNQALSYAVLLHSLVLCQNQLAAFWCCLDCLFRCLLLVGSTQQASANALKYNMNKSSSPNKY